MTWEAGADLVVVGSGVAGLTAAPEPTITAAFCASRRHTTACRSIDAGTVCWVIADELDAPIQMHLHETADEVERALAVEAAYGREPGGERNAPRTLDVDLIVVGERRAHDDQLVLPHPRAHERAFVLLPWLWLDADATLAGTPVADLAAVAADAPGVRRQEPERHRLLAGTDDVAPLRPARPDALGREAT